MHKLFYISLRVKLFQSHDYYGRKVAELCWAAINRKKLTRYTKYNFPYTTISTGHLLENNKNQVY